MDLEKYLTDINFKKQLQCLNRKLKNKRIVIYGSGQLFQTICKYYDVSKLNIVAVTDGKYSTQNKEQSVCGYSTILVEEIEELKPDFILVAILNYTDIVYNLENIVYKNKPVKIMPMVQKNFFTILKEIWLN